MNRKHDAFTIGCRYVYARDSNGYDNPLPAQHDTLCWHPHTDLTLNEKKNAFATDARPRAIGVQDVTRVSLISRNGTYSVHVFSLQTTQSWLGELSEIDLI